MSTKATTGVDDAIVSGTAAATTGTETANVAAADCADELESVTVTPKE